MLRFDVVIGVLMLVGVTLLGRYSGRLEDRLKEHQLRKVSFSRFAFQPMDAYRPAGHPILLRLRWTVAGIHVCAVFGVLILLYACPRL